MKEKTNVRSCFKERFAELRAKSGLSQSKLGKALSLSPATIGYYENGDRVPDIVITARIANYFSVSVDYLLGLSDVKSTEQDMKIACEVTGLSEKAVEHLSSMKNKCVKVLQRKAGGTLCPETIILDHLITSGGMYSICFQISWLLNEKRNHDICKREIEEKIQIMEAENNRLRKYHDILPYQTADSKAVLDLENEKEWYDFTKWKFVKEIEDISEDVINSLQSFYFDEYLKEVTDNAQHHETEE